MLERIWKKILRRRWLSLWAIPAVLLWLSSFVYRLIARIHRAVAPVPTRVDVPVISVGNITVGGSGKTPLVGFMAADLLRAGVRVGVVSSAYGRRVESSFIAPGYKVEQMDVVETGDEVMLLAHALPEAVFSVDRVKTRAAEALARSSLVDVIIVDDGFQHFGLARDIDIVAWDAGLKRRMLKAFPYGVLREPISALSRADVIIITRVKFARDISAIKRRLARVNPDALIYQAGFGPHRLVGRGETLPVKYMEDKSVFLFAGVGNFRALERQVAALAGDLDFAMELSDHQVYDEVLLEKIKAAADHYDSDMIITTAKDWVKLVGFDFGRETYYLELEVDLDPGEERLLAYFYERLGLPGKEA